MRWASDMRLRRFIPLFLAAIVFAGGLAIGVHFGGRSETENNAAKFSPPLRVTRSSRTKPNGAAKSSRQMGAAVAAVISTNEPAELSADESSLVAEISELQLLARGSDLELASDEWSALAAVTLRIQAIRQTYEAGIATTTLVAPGHYRMEIPGYANAGRTLREKFYAQLGFQLGDATAAEIIEKLGAKLEGHFGGFGVSLQTLDIAAGTQNGASDVQVTRTVTYVSQEKGAERTTTRRETFFPAWEDPSGDRWGALLAAIKT